MTVRGDQTFGGSIPDIYDTYLVPLIFEAYATDLTKRLASRSLSRVLEIAAGTGSVTRTLASGLAADVSIVATDLHQAMLDRAMTRGAHRHVEWRQADAMRLPFDDGAFDAVVCQFGVMFFPDVSKAFSEAHRVLKSDGIFVFNVWDRLDENEFANAVTESLRSQFRNDPPRFLDTPYGYYRRSIIERDLVRAGFSAPCEFTTIAARSRAAAPRIPAIAFCQGTPLRTEIVTRDPTGLEKATDLVEADLGERFGWGAVEGKMQAHVVIASR
jgi:SAM-dependent methyltransferase